MPKSNSQRRLAPFLNTGLQPCGPNSPRASVRAQVKRAGRHLPEVLPGRTTTVAPATCKLLCLLSAPVGGGTMCRSPAPTPGQDHEGPQGVALFPALLPRLQD